MEFLDDDDDDEIFIAGLNRVSSCGRRGGETTRLT
jgi:hypothetical protein